MVLACRNPARGEAAAEALRTETGNPHITAMELDLASLDSVRAFCDTFARVGLPPLYGVVCNAGVSAGGMPGGPPFFPVRVAHSDARALATGPGPGMRAHCMSKLCNLYCAYEMAELLADRPVTVNAFNPGAMSDTGFAAPAGNALVRGATRVLGAVMGRLIGKQGTATASGAALARLVTDPALATTTGTYIDQEAPASSSPLSHDRANARELWRASMAMTNLSESDTALHRPGGTATD
ncbi:hypothetical protein AB0465_31550 [Streptomyces griseoviridis]|uniref:hypothetical protein n=1 Tax=Streptomyces griseoviridis TaxID=45398 RepID=UPI0013E31481|nr:hypothetical protein [Streptomyces griseoviridis]